MQTVETRLDIDGIDVAANYDAHPDEDRVVGADFQGSIDGGSRTRRHVTHVAWRHTGSPATLKTGVIEERTAGFGGQSSATARVKLQVDLGKTGVRVALDPGDAEDLARTLLYMAQVARSISRS